MDLSLGVTLLQALPFVEGGLSLGKAQFHLGLAVLEVDLERYQGQTLLCDLTGETVDLPAVEEQLARPFRFVPTFSGKIVGRNMSANKEGLAVVDVRVRVFEFHASVTHRLDFRTHKHESGLHGVDHGVAPTGASVAGNNSEPPGLLGGSHLETGRDVGAGSVRVPQVAAQTQKRANDSGEGTEDEEDDTPSEEPGLGDIKAEQSNTFPGTRQVG